MPLVPPTPAGIASSSLVAIAYLMAAYNLDPYAAYSHVQGRRYCASVSPVSQIPLFLVKDWQTDERACLIRDVVSGVHGATEGTNDTVDVSI